MFRGQQGGGRHQCSGANGVAIASCGLVGGLRFGQGGFLLCPRHHMFTNVVILVSGNLPRQEGDVQLEESKSGGTGDCT